MGKKLRLNRSVIDKVCESISQGNYIKSACMSAGISERSYYDYMKQGDEDLSCDRKTIFAQFAYEVKEAEAKSQLEIINIIKKAAKKEWTAAAWIAERRWPALFGKRSDVPPMINQILIDLREKGRMLIASHSDNIVQSPSIKLLGDGVTGTDDAVTIRDIA